MQAAASAQSVASGQSAASAQAGASNLIAKAGQLMNDTESVTRRGVIGSERRRIDDAFDATVNRFDREIATWPRMEDDEFVARVTHLHAAIADLPRNDGYSQEPWGCEPALSTDF